MLNVLSFSQYNNLLCSEAIGNGMCCFELLVESNSGSVVKFFINANSQKDAIGFIERRFVIDVYTTRQLSYNSQTYANRLFARKRSDGTKAFTDAVIRRVM